MTEAGRPPVLVPDDGGFVVNLSPEERSLLRSVSVQLRDSLVTIEDPATPAPDSLKRLLPEAYPRDEVSQAGFEQAQRRDILAHQARALEILEETVEATHLSEDDATTWLDALVELRLVFGTALGVEATWDEPDTDDPRFAEWVAYGYLTYLASELVDALATLLPPYDGAADELAPEDPWGDPPGDLRWDGTTAPPDEQHL